MRNLRKLTAAVLAVALVLTSMATVFAATEETTSTATATAKVVNGDKAAVLKDLKLYEGKDAKDPKVGLEDALKVQDALIWLATEFGYKAEADKLTDEDADKALKKFADAKDVADYAKKVVAYSAQEGIIAGEVDKAGKFYIKPTASVKATRFATFMLKGLGYDLKGSFTEAVAQLKEVEGSKISGDETGDLTRDAAVGMMYGILTAKTDAGKTVSENLLAADSSLQTVLSKNSLLPVNGTLAVDTVVAGANNKVVVTLKDAAAVTAADLAIVKKGTTTAVAVKDVVKESDKVFVAETDALTAGATYTLTVAGTSFNFTGIAVDNSAPTIVKVTSPDTNTFEVEYSDRMDSVTATDIANYTFDKSLKVVKAELNGDRNKVKLTTDAAKRNVYYSLTVANVKNSDGKAISKATRNIQAVEDRTAPRLDPIKVQNNRMLVLTFQDNNGMNKAALETAANYSINDLAITSATAYDTKGDDDGKYETVVLMTETQTANKSYTLTIENLTDNSILANPLGKVSRTFRGASEDKSAPTVKPGTIKAENNNQITIEFSDNNAMDAATLEDVSNYAITFGTETLDVVSAKASETKYPDAYNTKKVTLTTGAQDDTKTYKVEVKAVADEFGNVLKQTGGKYPVFSVKGSKVDTIPAYVDSYEYVSETSIKLHFHDAVDKATATDPTNYSFDKDLGAPIKASIEKNTDDKVVKLTTPTLSGNTTYKLTINNVQDKFGNAMSNVKVEILAGSKGLDTTAPSISYIYAANKKEVYIYFDEKIDTTSTVATDNAPQTITVRPYSGTALTGAPITCNKTGILDDGKTLVYTIAGTGAFSTSETYVIETTAGRFADEAGNKIVQYTTTAPVLSDRDTFTSNIEVNTAPTVEYIEQTNVKKLKAVFSEPVKMIASSGNFTFTRGNTDIKDDYQTEWVIEKSSIFKSDEKVVLNFSAWATDLTGTGAEELNPVNNDTVYYTYMIDDVAPTITGVAAIDNKTIEVTYDEEINTVGTYRVTYEDPNNSSNKRTISINPATKDKNVVTIKTNENLELAKNYIFTVLSGATDFAGKREDYKDVRFDFAGSDVVTRDLVKGVGTTNAKKIFVTATKAIRNVVVEEVLSNNATVVIPIATGTSIDLSNDDAKKAILTVGLPLLETKTYRATVTYTDSTTDTFDFNGVTPDIGLALTRTGVLDLNGYTANEYYAELITTTSTSAIASTAVVGTAGTGTHADEFTFGAVAAGEYYIVLSRADDHATVVYAAKVIVE